ncbi:hypothetical protein RHSIM_Rhsim03G0004800 [Rhododendron simsii]|uniref:Uncharacterized protein n=1 Tax=Rhododendron simsii TaxID=118357 RepID=A0A834HAR2_RHOSS|nr:hypothetical protein RHSIM_Rhsim03G0004800 [Rhododendron simsii]
MTDDSSNKEQVEQTDSISKHSTEEKSTYKEEDTGCSEREEDDNDYDTSCFETKSEDDRDDFNTNYENDDPSFWFKDEYKDNNVNTFEQQYCCFPLSHINKSHLEDGNRIIIPLSAFDQLMSLKIKYPMVFEIINPECERASHCGVLEFSADEGFVFLPEWMMKNLQLYEGQLVTLKSTTLCKGTYLKIQPHSMKFFGLSDPKAVLEKTLRVFSCLTIGDTIMLNHDNNKYYIDILEAKPSSAVSVVETDCEVDFALALDYKEPEKKPQALTIPKREATKAEDEKSTKPKLIPFPGVARRLDGKPSIAPAELGSISIATPKPDRHAAADSNFKSCNCPEKLVSGSKDFKEKVSKDDEQKFQPFTGKKHTTRDSNETSC